MVADNIGRPTTDFDAGGCNTAGPLAPLDMRHAPCVSDATIGPGRRVRQTARTGEIGRPLACLQSRSVRHPGPAAADSRYTTMYDDVRPDTRPAGRQGAN